MAVKHFKINGITEEMMDRFMEFSNENQEHEWRIFLNSTGGGSETADWLAYQLNSHPLPVTLTASVAIYRAAFCLFYKVRRHRQLINGVVGMIHLPSRSFSLNAKGGFSYDEDKALMGSLKRSLTDDPVAAVLEKQERKKYDKGGDVFLSFDRMKEIFPDAEIIT